MTKYERLVREYERLAPRYDTHWKSYTAAATRETLARLSARSGDRILDVCCGTGELLSALALRFPDGCLAGIDLSPEILYVARGKLGSRSDLRQGPKEIGELLAEDRFASIRVERYKINWLWGLMTVTGVKAVVPGPPALEGAHFREQGEAR